MKSLIGGLAITAPLLAITAENPLKSYVKPQNPNEVKKRPTKWGEEWERVFNPPSLPALARGVPLDDLEYLIRLYRLDELVKKKNLGQIEMPDHDVRYTRG